MSERVKDRRMKISTWIRRYLLASSECRDQANDDMQPKLDGNFIFVC